MKYSFCYTGLLGPEDKRPLMKKMFSWSLHPITEYSVYLAVVSECLRILFLLFFYFRSLHSSEFSPFPYVSNREYTWNLWRINMDQ